MKNLLVAAMVALAAIYSAGCSVPSGQRTVGDVVDDSTITTRVKTRFVEDKIVSANRINVETLKGVVQLSGFATTEAERCARPRSQRRCQALSRFKTPSPSGRYKHSCAEPARLPDQTGRYLLSVLRRRGIVRVG